jgi:sucrose synthase
MDEFEDYIETDTGQVLKGSIFERLLTRVQVAAIHAPWIYLSVRTRIAEWQYFRFHHENVIVNEVDVNEFLKFEEQLIEQRPNQEEYTLSIDLKPFSRGFPRMKERRSIGRGVEFLNRHLSTSLFSTGGKGYERLFNFLRLHKYHGQQLLLNGSINNVDELQGALRDALDYLSKQPSQDTWIHVGQELQDLGFEAGWGRTVAQTTDSMSLLLDILEAPDPKDLEKFLGRIPMIFSLAIISPHGYFGQANVLGKPDTGGQIVYILDQVHALEQEMRQQVYEQGLDIEPEIIIITRLIPEAEDTTCDQRIEEVVGCQNVRILRVPFRNDAGEVVPHWISRFKLWPYLERFAVEAEKELLAELGHKPDLIIGNYSDGNLVATLMSHRLHVTQCNIAHALEKAKYLFSALYWKYNEGQYHFSTQFTVDLIAMNAADFIITSTYQEIAGTNEEIGQYESYSSFSMPDLYRVVYGIDVFDPKFNIVSPGSNPQVYFPYHDKHNRLEDLHEEIHELIFGQATDDARGVLDSEEKPLIFAMSRMDRIKNATGFIEWYAKNERIRNIANVLLIAGTIDSHKSNDDEEKFQIERMHELMNQYNLDNQVRWLGLQLDKNFVGELYRYIADCRGVFIQPALFENFGLTVIEAMISGLPTFATIYGGPSEIIEHGISGFHIDPSHGDIAINLIADFFERVKQDPDYWKEISDGGIKRVEARYTWKRYANRLMTLTRIYGFWKFVSNLEREENRRYLEMFYALMYRRLAENVPR